MPRSLRASSPRWRIPSTQGDGSASVVWTMPCCAGRAALTTLAALTQGPFMLWCALPRAAKGPPRVVATNGKPVTAGNLPLFRHGRAAVMDVDRLPCATALDRTGRPAERESSVRRPARGIGVGRIGRPARLVRPRDSGRPMIRPGSIPSHERAVPFQTPRNGSNGVFSCASSRSPRRPPIY